MRISEIIGTKRLDELQGIRQHREQTFYTKGQVREYLEEKGFECLGIGMYGGVFDHPSFGGRYVLKVFADPFYEGFLDWCRTQDGNPHLPRIVGKVMRLTGVGRMVRIERLEPMTRVVYGQARLGRYVTFLRDRSRVKPDEVERITAHIDGMGLTHLRETLDAVAARTPKGGEIDLSPENFMMRGETIVISDPYAGAAIPFLR